MVKSVRVEGKVVIRVSVIRIFVNRKGLSLRTIPRACERESEAIPSKPATGSLGPLNPPIGGLKVVRWILPNAFFAKQFVGRYFTKAQNHSLTGQKPAKHFASTSERDNRGVKKHRPSIFSHHVGTALQQTTKSQSFVAENGLNNVRDSSSRWACLGMTTRSHPNCN